MSTKELMETIEKVIREILNNQSIEISGESRFMEDLGLESIDLLDLSSELENSIGKEIDFKDLAVFANKGNTGAANLNDITINHLIQYIEEKVNE